MEGEVNKCLKLIRNLFDSVPGQAIRDFYNYRDVINTVLDYPRSQVNDDKKIYKCMCE